MDIKAVPIDKPEDMNFILGQARFIKTVEDLHEAVVTVAPHMKFGVGDGVRTKGVEGPEDVQWRKDFLRKIGYKL
ncbi:MAG: hypothetical protein FJY79_09895 [Candidatus Aminicenantes bacterium]|nr:hypothetical protein [Candidatus Aminicenantes bacterium]